MKKLLLASICIGAFAAQINASEAVELEGMYVTPKVIWAYQKIKNPEVRPGDQTPFKVASRHDEVWGAALAVGYDFDKKCMAPIRVEAEFALRESLKTDNAKLETKTLFVNAYYDIKNSTNFTPYVGAGIGVAETDFKIVGFEKSENSTNFAWNVGAGLSYKLCDKISADLGYRFVDYGTAKFSRTIDPTSGGKLKVHGDEFGSEVLLGVRYSF